MIFSLSPAPLIVSKLSGLYRFFLILDFRCLHYSVIYLPSFFDLVILFRFAWFIIYADCGSSVVGLCFPDCRIIS